MNYTTVYVTSTNAVVDTHKHAVRGGGHSEYTLFVKALLQKDGLARVPRGAHAPTKKANTSRTPRRSERLKRMLRAPEPPQNDGPAAVPAPGTPNYAALLPGAVREGLPIVSDDGSDGPGVCVAATHKGGRCTRKKKVGKFCTLHYQQVSSPTFALQLFDTVKAPSAQAMSAWEQSQVEVALQRSLTEDQEAQAQALRDASILDTRVQRMGLRRVPIAADGNCQFASICYSGQIPLTAAHLRAAVISYLRPLATFFADRMENQFRGRYGAYLDYMSQEGSWGDELTLLGAAHVLQRPIRVVTTSAASQHMLEVNPPEVLANEVWGQQIIICCVLDRHFDATEAEAAQPSG